MAEGGKATVWQDRILAWISISLIDHSNSQQGSSAIALLWKMAGKYRLPPKKKEIMYNVQTNIVTQDLSLIFSSNMQIKLCHFFRFAAVIKKKIITNSRTIIVTLWLIERYSGVILLCASKYVLNNAFGWRSFSICHRLGVGRLQFSNWNPQTASRDLLS